MAFPLLTQRTAIIIKSQIAYSDVHPYLWNKLCKLLVSLRQALCHSVFAFVSFTTTTYSHHSATLPCQAKTVYFSINLSNHTLSCTPIGLNLRTFWLLSAFFCFSNFLYFFTARSSVAIATSFLPLCLCVRPQYVSKRMKVGWCLSHCG